MLINWIRATWYYAGESMKSGTLEEQITDRHDNFISCFAPTNAKLCNVNRRDKPTKKNNYTKKGFYTMNFWFNILQIHIGYWKSILGSSP